MPSVNRLQAALGGSQPFQHPLASNWPVSESRSNWRFSRPYQGGLWKPNPISRLRKLWAIVCVLGRWRCALGNRALDDLVVIEFAQMVSGPMCGKMFADMGAEVIKIEPPGVGDEMRAHPPFPGDVPHPEKSGSFLYFNTSKKSITLDPATP